MPNVTIPTWVPPVATAETLNGQDPLSTIQANVPGLNTTIPLNYGIFQIGGKLASVKLVDTTWTVSYIIGIGEHQAIDNVLLNGAAPVAGTLVNTYLGTTSQGIDPLLAAADSGYVDTMVHTNENGSIGIAYVVIQYTDALYPGFPSVLVTGRGRKVYNPDNTLTEYSENPSLCLADLIRDPFCGFGEPVDDTFLSNAAAENDATVITEERRKLGISLVTVRDTMEWVDTLRTYAGCWPIKRGDTWYFIADRPRSVDLTMDSDDFKADTVQVGIVDDQRQPTVVKVIYTDTSQSVWREREACWPLNLPGGTPRRESTVRMVGVQRYSQALREAHERYAKLGRTQTISFIGTDEHIGRERGDVLQITHKMGLTNKLFRMYDDARQVSPGRWQIDAVEYDPNDYTNTETADPGGDATQKYFGLLRSFDGSVNTVYRQAGVPSGAVEFDLWFETDTDLLYTFDGSTWLLIGNAYSTVSQLTDDVGIQGAILGLNLLDSQSNVIQEVQALNQYIAGNNMGGEITGNAFMTVVDPLHDRPWGWQTGYGSSNPAHISYADTNRTIMRISDEAQSDSDIGVVSNAFKVNRSTRYRGFIRYRLTRGSIGGDGFYVSIPTTDEPIPQGKHALGPSTGTDGVSTTDITVRGTTILSASDTGHALAPGNQVGQSFSNRSITALNTWYEAEFEYRPQPEDQWASAAILNWSQLGANARLEVDSFFLYAHGTTNEVYRQNDTPTSGTHGDLWHETDTSLWYQYVQGVGWQLAANAYDNTGQLVDGAALGTTADWDSVSGVNKPNDNATRNTVYRQATQPTGYDGDLWYETDTRLWYQNFGGTWQVAANKTDNTSDLTDDANLGGTADWDTVDGALTLISQAETGGDVTVSDNSGGYVEVETVDITLPATVTDTVVLIDFIADVDVADSVEVPPVYSRTINSTLRLKDDDDVVVDTMTFRTVAMLKDSSTPIKTYLGARQLVYSYTVPSANLNGGQVNTFKIEVATVSGASTDMDISDIRLRAMAVNEKS